MGACASLPKGMRDVSSAAPLPEPPAKEESVQADQHNTEEVIKVKKEENKANEVDESKEQCLGSLLDDQPEKTEGKKESNEGQQPQVETPAEPKKEEVKPEPKKEEAKVQTKKEEPQAEAKKEQQKEEAKKEEPKPDQALAALEEIKEEKENKTETKETQ